MGIFVQHFKSIILLSFIMTSAGCALTSGLQTYDLPEEGVYQTDLGTHVNVVKLTQASLPAVQLANTIKNILLICSTFLKKITS